MSANGEKEQKSRYPIRSVVNSMKEVKVCPICLGTVTNRAITDSCSHEFCFDCINQWSESHNRCPICRQIYSNIKFNIKSKDNFEIIPVAEQLEVEEEEIEAILHRMLLYLRLIGLRNRTQRRRDQLLHDMNLLEEEAKGSKCSQKKKKELKKRVKQSKTEIRQLDEEILGFNQVLSIESPTEEALNDVLNGREDEIEDIEVIDIIFNPDDILEQPDEEQMAEDQESIGSLPDLIPDDDSGNESDDEREPQDETTTRKRKKSAHNRNTDSDGSGQSSSKRKKQ